MEEQSTPAVVIVTASAVEHEAVRDRVPGAGRPRPAGGAVVEVSPLGAGLVVLARAGEDDLAVRAFAPVAVLVAGLAGALRPDVGLGDIVVATRLYARRGAGGRRFWELDPGAGRVARRVSRGEAHERVCRFAAGRPMIHFGPVACPDAGGAPRGRLREHYDDTLAVEAATAGTALCAGPPTAVVRGISGRADGLRAHTGGESWQPRAARAAAAFAVELAAELLRREEEPARVVHLETFDGSHGAVAGIISGGVHTMRHGKRNRW